MKFYKSFYFSNILNKVVDYLMILNFLFRQKHPLIADRKKWVNGV